MFYVFTIFYVFLVVLIDNSLLWSFSISCSIWQLSLKFKTWFIILERCNTKVTLKCASIDKTSRRIRCYKSSSNRYQPVGEIYTKCSNYTPLLLLKPTPTIWIILWNTWLVFNVNPVSKTVKSMLLSLLQFFPPNAQPPPVKRGGRLHQCS